jgi:hypothetical protein
MELSMIVVITTGMGSGVGLGVGVSDGTGDGVKVGVIVGVLVTLGVLVGIGGNVGIGMQAETPAPKAAIITRTRTPLGISLPRFNNLLDTATSNTNGAIMTIRGSAAICPAGAGSGKDASGNEATFGVGCQGQSMVSMTCVRLPTAS